MFHRLQGLRKDFGLDKVRSRVTVEVDGEVHSFHVAEILTQIATLPFQPPR